MPTNTSLKDQIKHALDETLILITGAEILIGFQYSGVFNTGFERLPLPVKYLQIVGLILLLFTLILIMSPVPYHRIADCGKPSWRFCRFVRRAILVSLLPFALGLGLDVYIVTGKIGGQVLGAIAGVAAGLTALAFWYVIEFLRRERDGRAEMKDNQRENPENAEDPKLADKVDHVLTEARVVLPGAQALLGFQFAVVLVPGFDQLSQPSKYLHLLGLMLIAVSTILLMTPAAYHRIVEQGEDTEHFYDLAGRCVLAAMAILALGIVVNFYIVVDKVTTSGFMAVVGSAILLIMFYGLWFGYTIYKRHTI